MNIQAIKNQLISHEGLRLHPYLCTAKRLTLGVGRNLEDKGITKAEAMFMLDNDIRECIDDLSEVIVKFGDLPEPVQHALIDMRFNLGPGGFRSFRSMITAVNRRDYRSVVQEMMDSKWFDQVGTRGSNLVEMVQEATHD